MKNLTNIIKDKVPVALHPESLKGTKWKVTIDNKNLNHLSVSFTWEFQDDNTVIMTTFFGTKFKLQYSQISSANFIIQLQPVNYQFFGSFKSNIGFGQLNQNGILQTKDFHMIIIK